MAILVDRERQREHVAKLAARVVADEGVNALTFRRMAEAAGTSTSIVSNYFDDKRDLLLSTITVAYQRASAGFEDAMAAGAPPRKCLEAWLPLDEQRMMDWKAIIAFWGVAVGDPEFAAIQEEYMNHACGRIERLIVAHRPSRRVTREVAQTAQRLMSLTCGIAAQAVFESPTGTRIDQRRLLAAGLAEVGLSS